MRLLALVGVMILLTACRGTQPYTALDLHQVRLAYAEILPTYRAFQTAYRADNRAGMMASFRREQLQCKLVDQIDNRDTIDPNVDLFMASITLDDMCNAIESAYAGWEKTHHLPYDKTVVAGRPIDVFIGADEDLTKMAGYLRTPSALG